LLGNPRSRSFCEGRRSRHPTALLGKVKSS
jgi:hypothetical protein